MRRESVDTIKRSDVDERRLTPTEVWKAPHWVIMDRTCDSYRLTPGARQLRLGGGFNRMEAFGCCSPSWLVYDLAPNATE